MSTEKDASDDLPSYSHLQQPTTSSYRLEISLYDKILTQPSGKLTFDAKLERTSEAISVSSTTTRSDMISLLWETIVFRFRHINLADQDDYAMGVCICFITGENDELQKASLGVDEAAFFGFLDRDDVTVLRFEAGFAVREGTTSERVDPGVSSRGRKSRRACVVQ